MGEGPLYAHTFYRRHTWEPRTSVGSILTPSPLQDTGWLRAPVLTNAPGHLWRDKWPTLNGRSRE